MSLRKRAGGKFPIFSSFSISERTESQPQTEYHRINPKILFDNSNTYLCSPFVPFLWQKGRIFTFSTSPRWIVHTGSVKHHHTFQSGYFFDKKHGLWTKTYCQLFGSSVGSRTLKKKILGRWENEGTIRSELPPICLQRHLKEIVWLPNGYPTDSILPISFRSAGFDELQNAVTCASISIQILVVVMIEMRIPWNEYESFSCRRKKFSDTERGTSTKHRSFSLENNTTRCFLREYTR